MHHLLERPPPLRSRRAISRSLEADGCRRQPGRCTRGRNGKVHSVGTLPAFAFSHAITRTFSSPIPAPEVQVTVL